MVDRECSKPGSCWVNIGLGSDCQAEGGAVAPGTRVTVRLVPGYTWDKVQYNNIHPVYLRVK